MTRSSWFAPARSWRRAPALALALALALAVALGTSARLGSEAAAQSRQDSLLDGRLVGEGVVVVFAAGDSVRAEAVRAAFEAQPPLPALPMDLPRGVTVVLAPDEATFRRAAGGRPPEWSAAVALPDASRIVVPPGNSERLRGQPLWQVLRHEWAHVGLHQALPNLRVPRWFDEGYAEWAAGWDRTQAWRLRVLLALGRTPPLDSLALSFPGDRASAESAYLLAASAVEYLVQASGGEALGVFIEVWRDEGRFEAALRRVYGVTSEQLERDWRTYVRRRYGWLYVFTHSALVWTLLGAVAAVLFLVRRRRDRERLARLRAGDPPERPAYWLDEQDEPRSS